MDTAKRYCPRSTNTSFHFNLIISLMRNPQKQENRYAHFTISYSSWGIGVSINACTSSMVMYDRILSGLRIFSDFSSSLKGLAFIFFFLTAEFNAPFNAR